ncbi:hypothetical protein [Streptomyces fuscigenes]|uniref:hypothetical protein n=1 Tax=Streptomyces fuscigenes TaxID=1528880 RepID=UPI001F372C38|nr:hypothetical protein [Streptomyces fuscigenes]MCF3962661.1 hypothetical protein [Streptomyces fuscigenes]
MTTASDPAPEPEGAGRPEPAAPAQPSPRPPARPVLVFEDPLDQRSADDSDDGWGERPSAGAGSAADLARFLDEKPPHHI